MKLCSNFFVDANEDMMNSDEMQEMMGAAHVVDAAWLFEGHELDKNWKRPDGRKTAGQRYNTLRTLWNDGVVDNICSFVN